MPPKFGSDDFSGYAGFEEPQEGDTGDEGPRDERDGPELLWRTEYVEKLDNDHHVQKHEVKEVFWNEPYVVLSQRGNVPGDDKYKALGKTDKGRYLRVIYIEKLNGLLIISAYDMNQEERRRFEAKRLSQ